MDPIILTNIMSHLETHEILSDAQLGFRKHRSAELQLLQTIHDLALSLDNRGQTDIILLDFRKAFDKASHRHLLDYYGIRGNTLNWVSSSLTGRTQRVICGGCISDSSNVLSGMPQGSVLGPLLFLLYINDISQHLDSTCHLYADDCILYRNIKSIQDTVLLQKDLYLLEQWEKWKMSFNVNKCSVLSVSHKKSSIQTSYFLYSKQLVLVNSTKYLGVTIDSKSSFNQHVDNICKIANSVLGFL